MLKRLFYLYIGSRKRAPTSSSIVYYLKDGTLSANAKNIPDWTDYVKALSLLLRTLPSKCSLAVFFNK
jgi:hypothetical protein